MCFYPNSYLIKITRIYIIVISGFPVRFCIGCFSSLYLALLQLQLYTVMKHPHL